MEVLQPKRLCPDEANAQCQPEAVSVGQKKKY